MVEISVKYEGDLHCFAIHEPSRAELFTDAPKDNLGKGEAFSPTDLAATSLGVCMLTTMAIVAAKQSLNLDLSGTRASVRKHMTAKPPRRIQKLEVTMEIPLPENAAFPCHPRGGRFLIARWHLAFTRRSRRR